MSEPGRPDPANAGDPRAGRAQLARFLAGGTESRLFRWPTGNPARPTGFCFCDHSAWGTAAVCVRAALLELLLKLPCNGPKAGFLRHLGAHIDRHAYISAGAWIDPAFTRLLRIEEDVFIGAGARITLHEFRRDEFRAGRVILRRGAFVGGYAMIGCGVEIGEGATVAAGAVVGRDVPAGCTAIGNPARIVRSDDGAAPADGSASLPTGG